jgi:hypothetical protein
MITKQFFKTLSYFFHPIFMPILGLYFLFALDTLPTSYLTLDALFYFPTQAKLFLFIVVGILTVIAPLLSLLIMYWNKMIPNFQLENRQDRFYPFILVSFYYLLAYTYVRQQLPDELMHPALGGFLFGLLVVFFLILILNTYLKVSMHAAAIFGLCGMLLGYSQTQLAPVAGIGVTNLNIILYLFCVAGLVAGGRLYLKAHTLKEVIIGMAVGFTVMYTTVKFGIYI